MASEFERNNPESFRTPEEENKIYTRDTRLVCLDIFLYIIFSFIIEKHIDVGESSFFRLRYIFFLLLLIGFGVYIVLPTLAELPIKLISLHEYLFCCMLLQSSIISYIQEEKYISLIYMWIFYIFLLYQVPRAADWYWISINSFVYIFILTVFAFNIQDCTYSRTFFIWLMLPFAAYQLTVYYKSVKIEKQRDPSDVAPIARQVPDARRNVIVRNRRSSDYSPKYRMRGENLLSEVDVASNGRQVLEAGISEGDVNSIRFWRRLKTKSNIFVPVVLEELDESANSVGEDELERLLQSMEVEDNQEIITPRIDADTIILLDLTLQELNEPANHTTIHTAMVVLWAIGSIISVFSTTSNIGGIVEPDHSYSLDIGIQHMQRNVPQFLHTEQDLWKSVLQWLECSKLLDKTLQNIVDVELRSDDILDIYDRCADLLDDECNEIHQFLEVWIQKRRTWTRSASGDRNKAKKCFVKFLAQLNRFESGNITRHVHFEKISFKRLKRSDNALKMCRRGVKILNALFFPDASIEDSTDFEEVTLSASLEEMDNN